MLNKEDANSLESIHTGYSTTSSWLAVRRSFAGPQTALARSVPLVDVPGRNQRSKQMARGNSRLPNVIATRFFDLLRRARLLAQRSGYRQASEAAEDDDDLQSISTRMASDSLSCFPFLLATRAHKLPL